MKPEVFMQNQAAKPSLEQRAIQAAERALQDHHYVSMIDVLTGMRLLEPVHVEYWRKGRVESLLEMLQVGPEKFGLAVRTFHDWAAAKGLKPSEALYTRAGRAGPVGLKFSPDADPNLERLFRTHFVSPAMGDRKREKLDAKVSKPPQPVVFFVRRDSQCSECGVPIESGAMLFLDGKQALCMACSGMGDLEFLERGDTAMTRRATKYSGRSAVVVEFSRSRGRYERQGILVEPEAIARAEAECAADAPERAETRRRGVVAREAEDGRFVEKMTEQMRALFPRCPPGEARKIAAWSAVRGSGRVGRSEAGRKLDEQALTLAVIASVRHNHTNYDELLARGVDRQDARDRVRAQVEDILERWRG
jgi:hypothetical protein